MGERVTMRQRGWTTHATRRLLAWAVLLAGCVPFTEAAVATDDALRPSDIAQIITPADPAGFLRREPVGPALYDFRSPSVDDHEGLLGRLIPASRSCEFLERCGSRPQPGRLDHRNVGKRYRVRKRLTTAPTIPASSSATATGCEDDWFRGDSRQTASRFDAKSVDFFRR